MKRTAWLVLGLLMVALGVIGALLPVMPSTCFFIFAAYFFSRSSERWENWLLQHPVFGPGVVAWQETGAIPTAGKAAAVTGMSISLIILLVSNLPWWALGSAVLVLLGSAWFVLSRPTFDPKRVSSRKTT
jgi:uncharacterized protein